MSDFDCVLKVWPKVEADYNGLGGEVLGRLFVEHPDTLKFFPKFAGINPADARTNPGVQNHGAVVLRKVAELLRAKGSHAAPVKAMATTHANQHKIPIKNFHLLKDVAAVVLAEKVGLDAAGQAALKRILDIVIGDIDGHYKEIGFSG